MIVPLIKIGYHHPEHGSVETNCFSETCPHWQFFLFHGSLEGTWQGEIAEEFSCWLRGIGLWSQLRMLFDFPLTLERKITKNDRD